MFRRLWCVLPFFLIGLESAHRPFRKYGQFPSKRAMGIACTLVALALPLNRADAQWTMPLQLNPSAGTQGAPFIAIGPNGDLAVACSEYPTPTGSSIRVAVYRSTDRGQTFNRFLIPLPPLPYLSMGPSGLSFDQNGNLFVLWTWTEDTFPSYPLNLVLSKSTDGGSTYTTFWQTRQPLFWLIEKPMFIDMSNTIHIMWDSTITGPQFLLLYSKFINGSPGNLVSHVVPTPPTNGENIRSASMLISQDTVHFVARALAGVYTRSTDGGASFSAYILVDSLLRTTRIVSTTNGKAIFYGRHPDAISSGVPMLRFVLESSDSLSVPLQLPTKSVALSFTGDGGGIVAREGQNYLTYTGYDSVLVSCYYEYADFSGLPTDSAFFPHFIQTKFAVDSLGGKFLAGTSYPGEGRIYLMTKDVISGVDDLQNSQAVSRNDISSSASEMGKTAIITLRITTTVEGSLKLYDILGREVSVIHAGSFMAGVRQFIINAQQLTSGTYFVMFKSRFGTMTSKFVLLR